MEFILHFAYTVVENNRDEASYILNAAQILLNLARNTGFRFVCLFLSSGYIMR